MPASRYSVYSLVRPWQLIPLQDELAGPIKRASLLLMAVVGLILLIACANVANLMLARTADRASELSIRSALGASRARLVQQLTAECFLLSAVAAGAGLLGAFWTTWMAAKVEPAPLRTQTYSLLDWRVLGFAIVLALLSALLFGVLPSLSVGRMHVFSARGSSGNRSARITREALVAAQVVLTIILLASSVSIARAFSHLMQIDRGFNPHGLVTVSVSLSGTTRGMKGQPLPYFEQVLDRLRRLPEVGSASATEFLPLDATDFVGGPFSLDGRPAKGAASIIPVCSDYFRTMGTHIFYGREFSDAEVRSGAYLAVVNEAFAQKYVDHSGNAIGHEVTLGSLPHYRIVGVAQGTDFMSQYISGAGDISPPEIFVPSTTPGGFSSSFVVRVNGPAEQSVARIRDAIHSMDPRVPVFGAKTMEERFRDVFSRQRFCRAELFVFAGFALLLSLIGIYGIVSYAVAQRTREMGVRLALGATPVRLRATLLRQGLLSIAAAAICGAVGSALVGEVLAGLIEGARPIGLATSLIAIALVCLIASMSIWLSTKRIARLEIMDVVRAE